MFMRKYLLVFMFLLCTFFAGTAYADTEVSGIISQDTTWNKAGSPYIVTGNILVDEGAMLSVTEGVYVLFDGDYYLQVRGKFISKGKENECVQFKFKNDTDKLGQWSSIDLKSDDNILEYCEIENASRGIFINNSSRNVIINCNIYNNQYGIIIKDSEYNQLTNCNIYNNYFEGIWMGGTYNQINQSTIYNNSNGIILGGSTRESRNGMTITGSNNKIKDCQIYECNGYGIFINCSNNNYISGCSSYNNHDSGIMLSGSDNNEINNCICYNNRIGVYISGTDNLMNQCTTHANTYGVYLGAYLSESTSNNNVSNCDIYNNLDGVYVSSYAKPNISNVITYCDIHNNQEYGIDIDSTNNQILHCNIYENVKYGMKSPSGIDTYQIPNNYWGTTDKAVIEEKIYDFYDDFNLSKVIYKPFLTSPYKQEIKVASIILNPVSLNLTTLDSPIEIISTVEPENATNKEIIWESNDESVASVVYGKVTPKSPGAAIITARAMDGSGCYANCEVAVNSIDECFIATAAYGSKFKPSVVLLRNFRDKFLLTNGLGRLFVGFYYNNSPPIAKFISNNEVLKFIVRILLIPIIIMTYYLLHPPLIFLSVVLITFYLIYVRKRKMA